MENQRGGIRANAGRKSTTDKKVQLPIYIKASIVEKLGGEDVVKERIYKFIDNGCQTAIQSAAKTEVINQQLKQTQKIIYSPATNLDRTKYIPTQTEEKPKIKIRRTPANWVELRRECENANDYNKWLNDLENDPHLTIREKNQIKATV